MKIKGQGERKILKKWKRNPLTERGEKKDKRNIAVTTYPSLNAGWGARITKTWMHTPLHANTPLIRGISSHPGVSAPAHNKNVCFSILGLQ